MSYGWLTESALLPREKKTINVESKTFIDLKVNLLKEKDKLNVKNKNLNSNFISKNKIATKIKFKNDKDKNQGLNDLQLKENEDDYDEAENLRKEEIIKEQLIKKGKIYEQMKNGNITENDGLKDNLLVDFEMKKIIDKKKEKNQQDKVNNFTGDELLCNQAKVLAKQSFDKVLTKDEKIALVNVIEEERDYKAKLELLRRKKNLEREERIERIKKMKFN